MPKDFLVFDLVYSHNLSNINLLDSIPFISEIFPDGLSIEEDQW